MCSELDCPLVYDRVSSNLDKWPSTKPLHEANYGIIGSKLFPDGMDPCAPAFSYYGSLLLDPDRNIIEFSFETMD
jgi:hypothetical protein